MACNGFCCCCMLILIIVFSGVVVIVKSSGFLEILGKILMWIFFMIISILGILLYGVGCIKLVSEVLNEIERKMKSIQMSNWKHRIVAAYSCTAGLIILPILLLALWQALGYNILLYALLAVTGIMIATGLIYPDYKAGTIKFHSAYNDDYMIAYSFISVVVLYMILYDGYRLLAPSPAIPSTA